MSEKPAKRTRARKKATGLTRVETIPLWRCALVREGEVPYGVMRGPRDAAEVVRAIIGDRDRECFLVLFLSTQHEIIGAHIATQGTLSSSLLSPREVFKAAIVASASAIMIAHNHPSGDPTPSPDDRSATTLLVAAGKTLDIPIVDHVIIGHDGRYTSFVEQGLMPS